jgi:hypothetical protein
VEGSKSWWCIMTQTNFDTLASILFDGKTRVADFKTILGSETNVTREQLAKTLIKSMERMGLVKNGVLEDKNKA